MTFRESGVSRRRRVGSQGPPSHGQQTSHPGGVATSGTFTAHPRTARWWEGPTAWFLIAPVVISGGEFRMSLEERSCCGDRLAHKLRCAPAPLLSDHRLDASSRIQG